MGSAAHVTKGARPSPRRVTAAAHPIRVTRCHLTYTWWRDQIQNEIWKKETNPVKCPQNVDRIPRRNVSDLDKSESVCGKPPKNARSDDRLVRVWLVVREALRHRRSRLRAAEPAKLRKRETQKKRRITARSQEKQTRRRRERGDSPGAGDEEEESCRWVAAPPAYIGRTEGFSG
jgi:hypothetical protein